MRLPEASTLVGSRTVVRTVYPRRSSSMTAQLVIQPDQHPDAQQILVERVKRQRFAEATGTYDEVFAMQAGR